MSDDNLGSETQNEETKAVTTPADELKTLQDKLAKTEELLEKARKGETHNRNARKELEAKLAELEGDGFKSKFEAASKELEQLRGTMLQQTIDSALSEVAKQAGAKDIKAVLKLVDRTAIDVKDGVADAKAIEAAVAKTKEEFAVLFDVPKTPDVKRAGEGNVTDSFKSEMKAAKTQADIIAVMKKYGINGTI